MVTVTIGSSSRTDSDIEESWIAEQVRRRRQEGAPICVTVQIDEPPMRMTLRTADCGGATGGGRAPNAQERRIFDLWAKLHLSDGDFSGGNLIAFLKQWPLV